MPKAKPFSDDDEKTTIEESDSQWGDEASTTVEQQEVARALAADAPRRQQIITNVTNTNASALDESTVDDQHNPMLPAPAAARLVVTAGNDAGLEQAIDAGKAYTIGRGLDNDIVLTDIAVSRKHFDLRNDGGSWVIVDRGSGNGTVVNGNLEDNPFMLANGDVIEIGNTTFRFDFRAAEPIEVPPQSSFSPHNGFDSEEEEMSTVAGKPLNAKMLDSIDVQLETPRHAAPVRPKTLPPPTPLRPRSMTQPPAYPLASQSIPMAPQQPAHGTPGPVPATTLPMPQMRQQMATGPSAPTMLAADPINLAAMMPTTIPGQGMAKPQMQPQMHPVMHPAYAATGYPQATEIPPHSVHAQMMVVQGQQKRGDLSTAHVQPVAYGMVAQPQRFSGSIPLSKRTKYIAALGALTVLATIVTVALLRGGDKKHHVAQKADPAKTAPTVTPALAPTPAPTPPAPTPPPAPTQAVIQTPTPTPEAPKQQVAQQVTSPPKQEPPKQEPPKQEPPKQIAQKDPPKQEPKHVDHETHTVKRPDPPKQEPKHEEPKRVAIAPPPPPPDQTEKIDALYRDKKFSEAANIATASARANPDPDESSALKLKAQRLKALAVAFNSGMAPAAKATEAFDQLVAATTYDQNLGGRFESEISQRLAAIAPKAAMSFAGAHNYEKAHTAVLKAESLGAGSDKNVQLVKTKLEGAAQALYQDAVNDPDPKSSKDKLRQVKLMVDSKSPWFQKATSKLLGN
ncbi:MAG TPA: FHA domain-containing protein [Kofleriaceae bacterium]